MKVVNKTKAVIYIGSKTIKPGETAELSESEASFSGVKALIESGELAVIEEKNQEDKSARRKKR